MLVYMRTLCQKVCSEIGDKYFSKTFNSLAVLFFYSKLQLIQNFLTNGLIPLPSVALQIYK